MIVAVVAAVCAVHWPVLSARAISFDDDLYLTDNPLVQNPSWRSAGRIMAEVLEPSRVIGYYQPLSIITVMLDYAAGGRVENPRPFHRTSLALHAANTALVIVLIYMLLPFLAGTPARGGEPGVDAARPAPGQAAAGSGRAWIAAGVGLLFGLHPLTVEPIAWVGERKTTLSALFSLGCLIVYVCYAVNRRWNPRGREYTVAADGPRYAFGSRWWLYGTCLACYVLALLSKPTSTPLPLLMLLLDAWPLRRLSRRAVYEKIPFVVVGAVSSVITVVSCARTSGVELPSDNPAMRIPLLICHHVLFYFWKIAWPVNLSLAYAPVEHVSLANPLVAGCVAGAIVLIALLLAALRWTPAPLVGVSFFFVAIFPTLGLVGYSWVSMSDKYVYLPSVGLLIVVAWLLRRVLAGGRGGSGAGARTAGVAVVIVSLAGAEAWATRQYLTYWQDSETLYRHMLDLTPKAYRLLNDLGIAMAREGKSEEAIRHYTRAVELRPGYPEAHNNLAVELILKGKYAEAAEHAAAAVQLRPRYARAHYNRGVALFKKGDRPAAMAAFREALRLRGDFAEAHNNLAAALAEEGQDAEAIRHLEEAVRLRPDYLEAQFNLATMLARANRLEEAIEHYRQAVRLRPDDPNIRTALDAALAGRRH